ncbi:uncharacterized protein LTR77_008759 [Saxophila tyrrhenica]|uniref:Uncharacterized protein n=1 Tax=Saxophila tyrrhenica TaxID=1690608 RepID=A0AAV9P3V4_9PEZI|nr:hypothetical protein LTR77_008759 [Saxophila tyrrhenica]
MDRPQDSKQLSKGSFSPPKPNNPQAQPAKTTPATAATIEKQQLGPAEATLATTTISSTTASAPPLQPKTSAGHDLEGAEKSKSGGQKEDQEGGEFVDVGVHSDDEKKFDMMEDCEIQEEPEIVKPVRKGGKGN